jgi:tetratricopeptide (TPR) repeat protein
MTEMEPYTLDKLYESGWFEKGHSKRADEAIAKVARVRIREREGDASEGTFHEAWQNCILVLQEDLPNVSPSNLTELHLMFVADGDYGQDLLLQRFMAEIEPNNIENQCFLGHAYKHTGDLASAVVHYRWAYGLAMKAIGEKKISPSNPFYLDAIDYLRFVAETESELGRYQEAFLLASRGIVMTEHAKAEWKQEDFFKILMDSSEAMGNDDLARIYKHKHSEAKKKNPMRQ